MSSQTAGILTEYVSSLRTVNTHSHFRSLPTYDLATVFRHSYVNWILGEVDASPSGRAAFLAQVRTNSYFRWLERGLNELYGLGPITVASWDAYSQALQAAHAQPGYREQVLTGRCGYERIIHDCFWDVAAPPPTGPFVSAFRINLFLFGHGTASRDHNGNNPRRIFGLAADDPDTYVAEMRTIIRARQQAGCVGLKLPLAYDRDLCISAGDREAAARALRKGDAATAEDVRSFQDYMFNRICEIAAECRLPIQCHTGTGTLDRTNPFALREVISRHPQTCFVLLHGGYPWTDEMLGYMRLSGHWKNVICDLSWLPQLSTVVARRFLDVLLETAPLDRICWGCDTWTVEESLGSLMAMRQVLCASLADAVDRGDLSLAMAQDASEAIMRRNAQRIFHL